MGRNDVIKVTGSLRVFGYAETEAVLGVIARSAGWRGLRAGALGLGGLMAAPLLAVVPPHAPWALGAAGTGLALGLRKWTERFTLVSLRGACPRCGGNISVDRAGRLRNPAPVDCPACHHAVTLAISPEELPPPP